jgi:nicotinamidase-related amidase
MTSPIAKSLEITGCVALIVDVQEAFRSAIPDFALIASRIALAGRAFSVLGVPILVTEQYPKGLGRTAEEIVLSLPDGTEYIEKSTFSALGSEELAEKLKSSGAHQVILCGVETHVCVMQTALDLTRQGTRVHLLTDCVASRFEHDKQAGLARMLAAGVVSSSTEMALFEMMKDSKHEKFKEIQSLIK